MCKISENQNIRKDIRIFSFNVEGLASGLEDTNLLRLMHKNDICLLQETWKRDESKINLPGWWDFSQVRPKIKKAGRHSGGISVLCKNEFRAGIKIVESIEGFVWIKLDAKFFGLINDLFVCATYIPPQYSENQYAKKIDYFKYLSSAISKYGNKGNIMIAGDLNSRIGSYNEEFFHEINEIDELCPNEVKSSENHKQRLSCDEKINNYGKKLLNLCKVFNLKIINGYVPGDRQGSFTCYGARGSSVVDYFICDNSLFNIVTRMEVHPPQFQSIHAPISAQLSTKFQIQTPDNELLPTIPKIKWDEFRSGTYKKLLNQSINLERVKILESKLTHDLLNKEDLEECTKELTNILYSNASKCFRIVKKLRKRKIKVKNKPWFSKDCVSLKKRLTNISKLLQKSPHDPLIRGNFIKIKKD